MISILIADDHAIVRKGLVQILTDGSGTVAVDEAGSGEEALLKVRDNCYDLVLLDISLPGKRGLEVLQEMKCNRPELPVLMLSMHPEEQYAVRALRAGASGYVAKESAPDELAEAIRKVLAGGKYISASLTEKLVSGLIGAAEKPLHEALSRRELQVMRMIGSGKTVREIANELALDINTVNTFRNRILRKLNMKNSTELTRYAVQNSLED